MNRLAKALLLVLALLVTSPIWGFELAYRVLLSRVPDLPALPTPPQSSQAKDALWLQLEGRPDQGPAPLWVGNFFRSGRDRPMGASAATEVARLWCRTRCTDSPPRPSRSLLEAAVSVWLTRNASGEQLKELLGRMEYFGREAYGLDQGALIFFGRPLEELSVAQFALLVGLPQAPRRFDPACSPDQAQRRRDAVLKRLRETDLISSEASEAAAEEPILTLPREAPCR